MVLFTYISKIDPKRWEIDQLPGLVTRGSKIDYSDGFTNLNT